MSEPQGKWHIMRVDRWWRGNESSLLASLCLTQKCDKRPELSANKQMCQIGVKGLFVIVSVGFRLAVFKACSHLVRYNKATWTNVIFTNNISHPNTVWLLNLRETSEKNLVFKWPEPHVFWAIKSNLWTITFFFWAIKKKFASPRQTWCEVHREPLFPLKSCEHSLYPISELMWLISSLCLSPLYETTEVSLAFSSI